MLDFRLTLYSSQKKALINKLRSAEQLGNIRLVKRIIAVLSFAEGNSKEQIATMLRVSVESVRLWLRAFLLQGVRAIEIKKSPGRPPKLTNMQKKELAEIIDKGPAEAGFLSNCWRSPMIQHLIYKKYSVFYSVYYISQLLKDMGFSFQKARFVSDHLDEEARKQWLSETWPQILALADKKKAFILFGDEASFPQWGTLSYTWARKGKQPTIETSGKRKGVQSFRPDRLFYRSPFLQVPGIPVQL
jgi:transposase